MYEGKTLYFDKNSSIFITTWTQNHCNIVEQLIRYIAKNSYFSHVLTQCNIIAFFEIDRWVCEASLVVPVHDSWFHKKLRQVYHSSDGDSSVIPKILRFYWKIVKGGERERIKREKEECKKWKRILCNHQSNTFCSSTLAQIFDPKMETWKKKSYYIMHTQTHKLQNFWKDQIHHALYILLIIKLVSFHCL